MPLYTKYLPDNSRSEIELLIRCGQAFLGDKNIEFINNTARKDIDWNYLVQISLRHRVMPLLYRNLKNVCSNGVPGKTMEELRHLYLRNAARNIFLTSQLLMILDLLEKQDIPVIPFKGPVLAEFVYDDIVLRQFADLDILIKKNDIMKACRLFSTKGYQDSINLNDRQFMEFVRSNAQTVFINQDHRVQVGLHWEMSNRYLSVGYNFQRLMGSIESKVFSGKKIQTLQMDELLFYQCLHGTKDGWGHLEMISCVAELIRSHPEINWNYVSYLATTMRCERAIYLGLFLAHDLCGATLPARVMEKIAIDSKVSKIAEEVYKKLFGENEESPDEMSTRSQKLLFHISVRNRPSEKIRYCLRSIIDPKITDWIVFPLPASLSFLHYVLRPIRLAYKWVIKISHVIINTSDAVKKKTWP